MGQDIEGVIGFAGTVPKFGPDLRVPLLLIEGDRVLTAPPAKPKRIELEDTVPLEQVQRDAESGVVSLLEKLRPLPEADWPLSAVVFSERAHNSLTDGRLLRPQIKSAAIPGCGLGLMGLESAKMFVLGLGHDVIHLVDRNLESELGGREHASERLQSIEADLWSAVDCLSNAPLLLEEAVLRLLAVRILKSEAGTVRHLMAAFEGAIPERSTEELERELMRYLMALRVAAYSQRALPAATQPRPRRLRPIGRIASRSTTGANT